MKKNSTFNLVAALTLIAAEKALKMTFVKNFPLEKGEIFESRIELAKEDKLTKEQTEYAQGMYESVIVDSPAFVEKYNAFLATAVKPATKSAMVEATVETQKTPAELIKQFKKASHPRRTKIATEAGFSTAEAYLASLGTILPRDTANLATKMLIDEPKEVSTEKTSKRVKTEMKVVFKDGESIGDKVTHSEVKGKIVKEKQSTKKATSKTKKISNVSTTPVEDKKDLSKVPLPKEYNKVRILEDIAANGGKATEFHNTMLEGNDLKNMYYKLNAMGNRARYRETGEMDDETCRKIRAAIRTFKKQMKGILS